MAQVTMLTTQADLDWLREVHLPDLDLPVFRSAIIYGSEDFPDKVELYRAADPEYTDRPVKVIELPSAYEPW